jgi:RHS repeat-associated protein
VVEQINSSGTITYLHHDQQGSTRLLTGSTGTVTGSTTYDPYGNKIGSTGTTTTPLGYDAQYTSSDTGPIYLRARVYDPATTQFLTVDPLVATTRTPYSYAGDNPVNWGDASGRSSWNPFSESFWTEGNYISESQINPIPYYEAEIESYENGCGYFASVTHGLEGAVAGTVLFAGGEGEEEAGTAVEDALVGLTPGSSPGVYVVDSPEELQQIYDELSSGGKPTGSSYSGQEVELSNGTRVGIRETSKSGGPTIDINQAGIQYKIHVVQ